MVILERTYINKNSIVAFQKKGTQEVIGQYCQKPFTKNLKTTHIKANFVPFLGTRASQIKFPILVSNKTFSDCGALNQPKQILQNLKKELLSGTYSTSSPHAYLLQGNSGNGKTLLVNALAGELQQYNIPCIEADSGNFGIDHSREARGDFEGDGPERVANLFWFARNQAKKNPHKTAVIFIKNIDSMLPIRGPNPSTEASINSDLVHGKFQKELDKIEADKNIHIIVIATSSNSITIDKNAFDRFESININPPVNKNQRKEVIKCLLSENVYSITPDNKEEIINRLAQCTGNYNGQRIKTVLNIAQKYAQAHNRNINIKDIMAAYLDERDGNIKPVTQNPEFCRVSIAHEVGHALSRVIMNNVANRLKAEESIEWGHCGLVNFINLDPRANYTASVEVMYNPKNPFNSFEYNFGELVSNYSGKPCEALFNGLTTNGPEGDLINSYELIKKAVHNWGMGKNTGMKTPGVDNVKEQWDSLIQKDIELIMNSSINTAEKIVNTYQDFILQCANNYLQRILTHQENREGDNLLYPEPNIVTDKEFIKDLSAWEVNHKKDIKNLEDSIIDIIKNTRPTDPQQPCKLNNK